MINLFETRINQVHKIFAKIFMDLDISQKFIRSFITSCELNVDILSQEQVVEIKKALTMLVENARVAETRKMQQQLFMPIIQTAMSDDFITKFNNDSDFRLKFIELTVVMLEKSNLHDKDAEHHIHIANNLTKAAQKI